MRSKNNSGNCAGGSGPNRSSSFKSQVQTQLKRYGGSQVQQLSPESFDSYVEEHPHNLIAFYADWCPHCQALEPIYGELADTMGERGNVAAVDCVANQDFCTRQGVSGFPTLRSYSSPNRFTKYEGERTLPGMTSYMRQMRKKSSSASSQRRRTPSSSLSFQ